jgi:hypothetical protein
MVADVRVLSLLFRRRRRLSVDGLHTRRTQLRCVPFCSSRVAASNLGLLFAPPLPLDENSRRQRRPNCALYRHGLPKSWLPVT